MSRTACRRPAAAGSTRPWRAGPAAASSSPSITTRTDVPAPVTTSGVALEWGFNITLCLSVTEVERTSGVPTKAAAGHDVKYTPAGGPLLGRE